MPVRPEALMQLDTLRLFDLLPDRISPSDVSYFRNTHMFPQPRSIGGGGDHKSGPRCWLAGWSQTLRVVEHECIFFCLFWTAVTLPSSPFWGDVNAVSSPHITPQRPSCESWSDAALVGLSSLRTLIVLLCVTLRRPAAVKLLRNSAASEAFPLLLMESIFFFSKHVAEHCKTRYSIHNYAFETVLKNDLKRSTNWGIYKPFQD